MLIDQFVLRTILEEHNHMLYSETESSDTRPEVYMDCCVITVAICTNKYSSECTKLHYIKVENF